MSIAAEARPLPEDWEYHHNYEGMGYAAEADELINQGLLPRDTWLKLAGISRYMSDPRRQKSSSAYRWTLMSDMIKSGGELEKMRRDTRQTLTGDWPKVIVDWELSANRKAYTQLDPMYYRLHNLTTIIGERRQSEGRDFGEDPPGWWSRHGSYEKTICHNVAQNVWKALVRRCRPELLENPGQNFEPTIAFNQVYYSGEATMRRQVIGQTVLRDDLVLELYRETRETGIRGIAKEGRESLRLLLADEHPELHEAVY